MKVKKQSNNPCWKKGIDNPKGSNRCEVYKECKKLKDYLKPNSTGTDNYHQEHSSDFEGCEDVESYLIKHNLVRYESREAVVSDLIINSFDIIPDDHNYRYIDPEPYDEEQFNIKLKEKVSFIKIAKKLRKEDKSVPDGLLGSDYSMDNILNHLPAHLGLSRSFAHEIFKTGAKDLFETTFRRAFAKGLFYQQFEHKKDYTKAQILKVIQADDLLSAAMIRAKGITDEEDMLHFWPRYTKERFDEQNKKIDEIVIASMPYKFIKFNKIWDRLTPPQAEAFKLEYFYDSFEKPTQLENAKKLGVKLSSYKDRLEGAIKKLEKLYPEFERVNRRAVKHLPEAYMDAYEPVYKIENGERSRISPLRIRPKRIITEQDKVIIKKWAQKTDYQRSDHLVSDYKPEIDESYYYDPESLPLDEVFPFH